MQVFGRDNRPQNYQSISGDDEEREEGEMGLVGFDGNLSEQPMSPDPDMHDGGVGVGEEDREGVGETEEDEELGSSAIQLGTRADRGYIRSRSPTLPAPPSPSLPKWLSITVVLLVVGLAASFWTLYSVNLQLKTQVGDLTDQLGRYEKQNTARLGGVGKDMHQLNADLHNSTQTLQRTQERIQEQEVTIHGLEATVRRLSNRTTNADVLDSLKKTHVELKEEMESTKKEVAQQLSVASITMAKQANATRDAMQKAEEGVKERLAATLQRVGSVVDEADKAVQSAQDNVAAQLMAMSHTLDLTVERIKVDIRDAEKKIHADVHLLQSNVDSYVQVTQAQFAQEDDFVKYQLAGTFTLLGCLISMWHLTSHLRHYYKPEVQRRIMAVLWMVPIYGITSWLSLVLPLYADWFGAVRDCYEAYAVYTFIAMLIAILEDGKGMQALLTNLTQQVITEQAELSAAIAAGVYPLPKLHLVPPIPCCYDASRPARVAVMWIYQCKLMAMQFVLLKPLISAVPLVCWLASIDYDGQPPVVNGSLDWSSLRLYVLLFSNVSVAMAFYGLLTFYHGLEKDLQWCNPWPKFLCIKGVVFMTFWQGMAIRLMAGAGFVGSAQGAQIQNLVTCIEMLLASLAHFYIFPYYEWADDFKREQEKGVLIRDTLALRDFVADMRSMVSKGGWGEDVAGEGEHEKIEGEREGEGEGEEEGGSPVPVPLAPHLPLAISNGDSSGDGVQSSNLAEVGYQAAAVEEERSGEGEVEGEESNFSDVLSLCSTPPPARPPLSLSAAPASASVSALMSLPPSSGGGSSSTRSASVSPSPGKYLSPRPHPAVPNRNSRSRGSSVGSIDGGGAGVDAFMMSFSPSSYDLSDDDDASNEGDWKMSRSKSSEDEGYVGVWLDGGYSPVPPFTPPQASGGTGTRTRGKVSGGTGDVGGGGNTAATAGTLASLGKSKGSSSGSGISDDMINRRSTLPPVPAEKWAGDPRRRSYGEALAAMGKNLESIRQLQTPTTTPSQPEREQSHLSGGRGGMGAGGVGRDPDKDKDKDSSPFVSEGRRRETNSSVVKGMGAGVASRRRSGGEGKDRDEGEEEEEEEDNAAFSWSEGV